MEPIEPEHIRKLREIERSCKYCVICGKRLKPKSYDHIHKKCVKEFEEVSLFDNWTGDTIK